MVAGVAFCVLLAYRLDDWAAISLFYTFIPLFIILVNSRFPLNLLMEELCHILCDDTLLCTSGLGQ